MDALVTHSEDVAWGAAIIAGTRVPVDTLFEYRAVAILEVARQRVGAEAVSG